MRIHALLLALPLLAFLTTGCGDDGTAPGDTVSKGNTEKADRPAVEAKGKPVRKAYTEEELNRPYSTVSPWRYIVTGPETQYFERLGQTSKLGRTVHGSRHAVLVPRDITFKDNKDWKALMEEENFEVLERFVQAHIIVGIESKKSLEGVYEDLNGKTVAIETDDMGQLICGGARLLGQEVETDQGLVIPVVGMVEDIRWN